MGYDVQIIPKTRNEDLLNQIYKYENENNDESKYLSRKFSMFQSRLEEPSELKQVQKILSIDLKVYIDFPVNFKFDHEGELEYRLYQANKENDIEKVNLITNKIKKGKKQWELTFDSINQGWSKIEDVRSTTKEFIKRINDRPGFANEIFIPKSLQYSWGNYFSIKEKKTKDDDRILDDLTLILFKLDCIEKFKINYVAFIGG